VFARGFFHALESQEASGLPTCRRGPDRISQRSVASGRRTGLLRSFVPQLVVLEDRTVLSVLTVLNKADNGAGSLRAAIAAAQSGDTMVFDPSLAYETITLSGGPLAISSNLTIDGLGANQLAISHNNASQLFMLSGSARVTLANLTLTGGHVQPGGTRPPPPWTCKR
jgi:hypothetical protein